MKSFKDHLLTETPMKSTFEDIYKRSRKQRDRLDHQNWQ